MKELAIGILLLAHGGTSRWNQEVMAIQKKLRAKNPVETAFGMADARAIQRALDRLAYKRVRKVVAVPLFVSSHSEVMDQTKFVLGVSQEPSSRFLKAMGLRPNPNTLKRAVPRVPLVLTQALDDHPVVARIALERAKDLSLKAGDEAVVLVGHGPVSDQDNALWLEVMGRLAQSVKKEGGFAAVEAATLRDDAPKPVKEESKKALRSRVERLGRSRRVLVVPLLIAPGGVEDHIQKALEGKFYRWNGKTLLPHPAIHQWVEAMVREGASKEDMRLEKPERPRRDRVGGLQCGKDSDCLPCGKGCISAGLAPYAECMQPTHDRCVCAKGECTKG